MYIAIGRFNVHNKAMKFFSIVLPLLAALTLCADRGFAQDDNAVLRFTTAENSTKLHFEVADNLILVRASLNGSAPEWFIFDTGAESSVVNQTFAKQIGLRSEGTTVGNGATGSATAGIIKGVTLRLGDLEAKNLTVYALSIGSFEPILGSRISGIIGNDVIGKVVADIDYIEGILTLYSQDAFKPDSGAEVVPILIEGNVPFVKTMVTPVGRKPVAAKLEIDTGSTGAVLFNSPFVRKHQLIGSLPRSMERKTGGVGGTTKAIVGRAASVQLGGSTISEPIAVLYIGNKGENASDEYDGLLGGAIFRRFRMAVDLAGKRLFLQPTASVNDPFETDMSGLELLANGKELTGLLVDDVKPGSTAARAGVRGGDLITSINGRPASDIGLQEAHRMMRTPGEYDLTLLRRGRAIKVHLSLKRVV